MRTISHDIENEIIIKKSKFICHLYYVNNIEDINNKIDYINTKYKDATHNCYAYICGNLKKMSDDKEPSGTAGMPMLNILEMNNLNNILVIVTRYFGGIKLGANGLVRAYSDSVKEALNLTSIITLTEGYLVEIEFGYDKVKQIDYLLKNNKIISKIFMNNITYKFEADMSIINELNPYILNYKIISTIMIENK